ncbi:MAG: hypothetical protein WEK74_07380 [Hydrogenophaga sp.]
MTTHEVFNQVEPLVDVNLYDDNRAMQSALAFDAPTLYTAALSALGERVGSAEMQTHARLTNVFTPEIKSHDRFGRRIDRVECHPSFHALMSGANEASLHGTAFCDSRLVGHWGHSFGTLSASADPDTLISRAQSRPESTPD